MDAKTAIIAAFAQLPTASDGYKSIGDVAHLAADLLGGSRRRNLALIRQVFEQEWRTLPFEFSTHMARTPALYRCGRRKWPQGGYLCDGVTVGSRNWKVMKRRCSAEAAPPTRKETPVEYTVVESASADDLSTIVTALLVEGWEPWGSLTVLRWEVDSGEYIEPQWWYVQPLVRKETPACQ